MENPSGWAQAAIVVIINVGAIVYLSGRWTGRVEATEKSLERIEKTIDDHVAVCMTRELFDSNLKRLELSIEHVREENKTMLEELRRRQRAAGIDPQ